MARATLESGMAHIVGFERDQLLLLRAAGDDYVEADNPLRFIDAFVDGWPLQRRGLRASKPRRRAGPAARRGALRSVRRPMRPKRPQFPATRSSVTARARCGPRGSFGDQGHPPEDDGRGRNPWRPISSTQPHAGTPLPSIGFSPGSRAPDMCDLDRQMTASRRLRTVSFAQIAGAAGRPGERAKSTLSAPSRSALCNGWQGRGGSGRF